MEHSGDLEACVLPEHGVNLVRSEFERQADWEGERSPWRRWAAGDVAFIPRDTRLSATVQAGVYQETLILLSHKMFARAVRTAFAALVTGKKQ